LLDEKNIKKEDKIIFIESSSDKKADLDDLDKKILELLAPNSRIKTIEIAEKLKTTVNTINSRIKKLQKIWRYTKIHSQH